MKMENLLSGLCGALIAIIFNYILEQIRYRKETMMEVITWEDRIYNLLQLLHVYKNKIFSGQGQGLDRDDYKDMGMELTPLLTSTKIFTLVHLAYGDGEELRQANEFQNELKKINSLLRSADPETWPKINEEIINNFKQKIDPLRASIRIKFVKGTGIERILCVFFRNNLPTGYNILTRIVGLRNALYINKLQNK